MSWLVIVLILLAAFGPLFWMLPSKSDRRLAKMRSRARALGMQVEMTQLRDLAAEPSERVTAGGRRREPMVACAAYRLPLPRMARAAPQWRLLRSRAEVDGPLPGWQWDSEPAGQAPYWSQVKPIVDALPADALACSAHSTEVGCWWRERAAADTAEKSVESLHATLAKLLELQCLTDAAIRAADEAEGTDDNG